MSRSITSGTFGDERRTPSIVISRGADPHRADLAGLGGQHARDAGEGLDELVGAVGCGLARLGDDVVLVLDAVVDDHAEALRAADVDAQAAGHDRRPWFRTFRLRRGS
jgi:hypothetical protein